MKLNIEFAKFSDNNEKHYFIMDTVLRYSPECEDIFKEMIRLKL